MINPVGIRPIFNDKGEIATKIRYEAISLLKKSNLRDSNNQPIGILKTIEELPAGVYVIRNALNFDGFSNLFYNRREIMETLIQGYLIANLYYDPETPIAYRAWWLDDEKGWLLL